SNMTTGINVGFSFSIMITLILNGRIILGLPKGNGQISPTKLCDVMPLNSYSYTELGRVLKDIKNILSSKRNSIGLSTAMKRKTLRTTKKAEKQVKTLSKQMLQLESGELLVDVFRAYLIIGWSNPGGNKTLKPSLENPGEFFEKYQNSNITEFASYTSTLLSFVRDLHKVFMVLKRETFDVELFGDLVSWIQSLELMQTNLNKLKKITNAGIPKLLNQLERTVGLIRKSICFQTTMTVKTTDETETTVGPTTIPQTSTHGSG
ncbi:unnamed protein product, partial [Owenia fusiformis]